MHLFRTALLCIIWYLFPSNINFVNGISVCDPIDVFFFVDYKFLLRDHISLNLLELITNVIYHGMAEDTGFSVILYGDDIPIDINPILFSIDQTESIHRRELEEQFVLDKLEECLNKINNNTNSTDLDTQSIDLEAAFELAENEDQPNRGALGDNKYNGGFYNDEHRYFIFDFSNKLLTINNEYFWYSLVINDNINAYYIFGQQIRNNIDNMYDGLNESDIDIYNDSIDNIHSSMYYFDDLIIPSQIDAHISYLTPIQKIYALTCPSYIEIGAGDSNQSQSISLKSHIQIVEYDTLLDCKIIYKNNYNGSIIIDSNASYIYVFNDLTEESTSEFQIDDILLIDQDIVELIPHGCRNSFIYKIIDIEYVDIDNDEHIKDMLKDKDIDDDDQFEILKLNISSVKTPFEYILAVSAEQSDIDITDTVDVDNLKRNLLNILDISFGEDFVYKKTANFEFKSGNTGSIWGRNVGLKLGGELEARYGYKFRFKLNADVIFKWDLLEDIGDITLEFKLSGEYELMGYFNLTITGSAVLLIEKLLYEQMTTPPPITIGSVPVIYHPYFQIDASAGVKPIKIFAGITCRYGRKFAVGYHFENERIVLPTYTRLDNRNGYVPTGGKRYKGTKKTLDGCATAVFGKFNYFSYNSNSKQCYGHLGSATDGHYISSGWGSYAIDKSCSGNNYERCTVVRDGEYCVADWDCRGSTGLCCKNCCTRGRKDWVGLFYWCPHVCVGKFLGKPGTCGGKTYSCRNNGKLGLCNLLDHTIDKYGDCRQCRHCWFDISRSSIKDVDKSYPINIDEPLSTNGCFPSFSITNTDDTSDKCGFRIGLDIKFDIYIGVRIYFIINAYIRSQLYIPVGYNIPETSTAVCKKHDCSKHEHFDTVAGVALYKHDLYVSSDFGIYLSFYVGVGIDISIVTIIIDIIFGTEITKPKLKAIETQIGNTITIFETTNCVGKVETPIFTESLWQDCCNAPPTEISKTFNLIINYNYNQFSIYLNTNNISPHDFAYNLIRSMIGNNPKISIQIYLISPGSIIIKYSLISIDTDIFIKAIQDIDINIGSNYNYDTLILPILSNNITSPPEEEVNGPIPSELPTKEPSIEPTTEPTIEPTIQPTYDPSNSPTTLPTFNPSIIPTNNPTTLPTFNPSVIPTIDPTALPTFNPSVIPTIDPTALPTFNPSVIPTNDPTQIPTSKPTCGPTLHPSDPTDRPTDTPTENRRYERPTDCCKGYECYDELGHQQGPKYAYKTYTNYNEDDCCDACSDDDNCASWTLEYKEYGCFLFTTKLNSYSQRCSICSSGNRIN